MASTPRKNPGPKPDHVVVGDHHISQTNEGEISLDLRIPIKSLEKMMTIEGSGLKDADIPRYMLDEIMHAEDRDKIEGMRDGIKGFEILMKYLNAIMERLGAGLGESSGSTDSSESTVQPSEPTSEPATD